MARTPSMTTEECESILGPRGSLLVTSENRGVVQKWLVARGVPASIAKSARLSTLTKAYNNETYLQGMLRNIAQRGDAQTKNNNQDKQDTNDMNAVNPLAQLQQNQQDSNQDNDVARELAAVLAKLTSTKTAPLDESRVIELIEQHAPKPEIPVYKIELTTGNTKRELPAEPRHYLFEDALRIVSTGLNLFIVGPAGSGKTTLADQIARALDLPFYFNGALDSPYKLSGFIDAQGRIVSTAFRKAYQDGGVYLFDEIDASMPNALLAFNAALANGHADFPDGTIKRHQNFRCIAAANTYGLGADRQYVGRNQLDAASLDRFVFLEMPYDEKLESLLAGNDEWTRYVQRVRKAVATLKMRHVVSPRASIQGATLLAAGLSRDNVEQMTLWRNLSAGDVAKVKQAIEQATEQTSEASGS